MHDHGHNHGQGQEADRRSTSPTVAGPNTALTAPAPGLMTPQRIAALQSSAGNAAVVQLLRQADLPAGPHQHGAGCGHQQPERPAPTVQRSAVHSVLSSGGRPLDGAARADMESRFGADFSDVRIHDDSAAKASAAEVGARAYTSGNHVVLGEGGGDKHTLAHELTHVIQQRRGPVAGTDNGAGLRVSDPSDRFEREAEANATRVMSAAPVQRATDEAALSTRPGGSGAIQRMPAVAADAQSQNAQKDQIELLTGFYVPAETFGPDGSLPQQPAVAHLVPQHPTDVDLLRVNASFTAPREAAGRRATVQTNWCLNYQSSFFVYTIELINDPQNAANPTRINLDAPFRITRRSPRGSAGRSGGRTYAFGDRWGVHPASGVGKDAAVETYGLDPEGFVGPNDVAAQNLTQLPADASQPHPIIFYVPAGRRDSRFLHDGRRFATAAQFDAQVAGGTEMRGYRGLSERPQVDRRDGQRNTASAMGNTQAHEWMGPGNGGSVGQLAKYEWCHLVGDGDGGPSSPENLVIGTNAVNTEQLALETALRELIPTVKGRGLDIRLEVQALMQQAPDESVRQRANVALPNLLQADWISYDISLVKAGDIGGQRVNVHRHIMDAKRGTMTESEFVVLRSGLKSRFKNVLDSLPTG
ncbi:hypothetical protein GCM10009738_33650 [Kitasatospora viridis]|nr:DUF4157 domain-containing protein [Kitasatospora viridis]